MNQTRSDPLSRAATLLRSGYRQDARELLIGFLKENPDSVKGWWLMSYAIDDAVEQVECLEKVLKLYPQHKKAKSRLKEIRRKAGIKSPLPVSTPAIILIAVVACLILIGLGYFGYQALLSPRVAMPTQAGLPESSASTASSTDTAILPPTWTNIPSSSPTQPPEAVSAETATPLISITPSPDPNTTSTPIPESQIGTGVGLFPPDFRLVNALNNAEISPRDYLGQPVIIVFLNTMSTECAAEMPALRAVYEKYKDQGLVVIGVGVGASISALRTYSGRFDLTFPLLSDWEHDIAKSYGVETYPTNFIIRKNGRTWESNTSVLTEDELETLIESILKVP